MVPVRPVFPAFAACVILGLSGAGGSTAAPSLAGRAAVPGKGLANLWLDTNGGRCRRQSRPAGYADADACGSLRSAYTAAHAGDTINVKDGVYGSDTMGALDKPVLVRAAGPGRPSFGISNFAGSGVTIRGLKFEFRGGTTADDDWTCLGPPPAGRGLSGYLFLNGIINPCGKNITFDNVEVDGLRNPGTPGHCPRDGIEYGGDGFTFENGSVHGVYDRSGANLYANDVTIQNTKFYDIRIRDFCYPDVHNECIYIPTAKNAIFRNNTFLDCPVMALYFSGNPDTDSDDVTVEGNVFTHTLDASDNWHSGSCALKIGAGPSRIDGWVVRYNTFETSPCIDDLPAGDVPGQWYGNVGGAACIRGFVYHDNVGDTCGGRHSLAVRPATNDRSAPNKAPFYVDAPAGDFRLKPGSAAIGRGDLRSFPASDARGKIRPIGGAPDAGAFEYVPPGSTTYLLDGSGTAMWKQAGDDRYVQRLSYRWKGTLTIALPAAARGDAAAGFRAAGQGLLSASWTGILEGRRAKGGATEPYRCTFRAARVVGTVRGTLVSTRPGKPLELTLRPRKGSRAFFAPSGAGASATCTTAAGRGGPPRFSPAALFQEGPAARGRAELLVPRGLLAGRAVRVTFPAPAAGSMRGGDAVRWTNRGRVTLRPT